MLKSSNFCIHAALIIGAIVLITLRNIHSWHALPRNEPGKTRYRVVKGHTNDTSHPPIVFPAPPPPLACFVVTFKQPKDADPMQTIAYRNTARMYKALEKHGIMSAMALTGTSHTDSESIWKEAGNEHVLQNIELNEYGTPFLKALIEKVERSCPASTPFVAYANADIMFNAGLVSTLKTLKGWGKDKVLVVGKRKNHDLKGELSMENIHTVDSELFIDIAQDYFIMTRGLFGDWSTLPSYVIGRRAYDNALVDWAFHNANLVDATGTIVALHQTTGDGNYAGHTATNLDKEYNVNLPGAKYDHGSVGHARFQLKPCKAATPCVYEGEVALWPEVADDEIITYTSARSKEATTFEALPDLVFVVFGNDAYMPVLMNFLCNTAAFPPMHKHTLMLVTSKTAADELVATGMDITVGLVNEASLTPMQDAFNYDTAEYKKLMQLRGKALISLLNRGKSILWMEADAHYSSNLLNQPQVTQTQSDLVLFWDHLGWGGGFIRFAPSAAAKQFYVDLIKRMRLSGQDDQITLNEMIGAGGIHARNITAFDKCVFKSGAAIQPDLSHHFTDRCAGITPVVQQHNWVIGVHTKINLAKSRGEWFLEEKDYRKCRPRDLRLVVMTMDRANSLRRLLESLKTAIYKPMYPFVDLQVNVDIGQGPDGPTMELLNKYEWPHGFFEVNVWDRNVGIYGQWVDSWPSEQYPSWLYRAVVFLEDDLQVSPHYAQWFIQAHETYKSPRIGAVTGMRAQLVAKSGARLPADQLIPQNVHAFAYKLIATWSMSPTHAMWTQFRAWLKEKRADPTFVPTVPGIAPSEWYMDFLAHGKEMGMWEMWFVRFAADFNYYTVYPWLESGASTIVCNWREKGLHYTGDEVSQDFPLMPAWEPLLLTQNPLPMVEWDLAFYVCLTGYLYGQFSNQLLTISAANQYAKDKNKFLRLQSVFTPLENRMFLTQNWNNIFNADSVPYMVIGENAESCSEEKTYEDMYLNEFLAKRHMPGWFVVPEPALKIQEEAIHVTTSVHGRSIDSECHKVDAICSTSADQEATVPDMCRYDQEYVRKTFSIAPDATITLFSDNQSPQYDATYQLKDDHAFPVQLWSMVLSPNHIGNPKSSVDYLISLWKKQRGMEGTMQPLSCYGGDGIEQQALYKAGPTALTVHFVWVQPNLRQKLGDAKELQVMELIQSWKTKFSIPVTVMVWTRDEIAIHFAELVPLLERLHVASWISDIMRYQVLYKFGGLYIDTDEYPLSNPSLFFQNLNTDSFAVCQTPWLHPSSATLSQLNEDTPCESVAAGIIYAPIKHIAVQCAMNQSVLGTETHLANGNTHFNHHLVGPTMWTQCVQQHAGTIRIFPSWTFLPCPCCDNCNAQDYEHFPPELVVAMHKWEKSWW